MTFQQTFDSALEPALRVLLVIPVAIFLASVLAIATLASHDAVSHMSAVLQQDGGHAGAAMAAARPSGACVRPEAG